MPGLDWSEVNLYLSGSGEIEWVDAGSLLALRGARVRTPEDCSCGSSPPTSCVQLGYRLLIFETKRPVEQSLGSSAFL
jgi:hypothetical protein